MYKSILQFCEKGSLRLEDISADFFERSQDIASFVGTVQDEIIHFSCAFMGEVFENLDTMLRESSLRKESWEIVRADQKTLLTSLEEISYRKTLFKHKKTQERTYLLDRYLDLPQKARMTEDAQARLLEEAVQTSYRRAGEAVSLSNQVSKSTVKNKIHQLRFPKESKEIERKEVKTLYVDADEDHVPLQFFEKKGDIEPKENGRKYNTLQTKLIYVYEGIEKDSLKGKRCHLVNPHYFSGVYEGKENEAL